MKAINPKWEWEISIINFSWKEKREVWEVIVPKGTFQILKAKTLLNSLYNLKWKQQIWVLNKLKSSHPAFFFFFSFSDKWTVFIWIFLICISIYSQLYKMMSAGYLPEGSTAVKSSCEECTKVFQDEV